MSETITLPNLEGTKIILSRCEEKLRDFCLHDAYQAYDRIATINDVVTMRQFDAVNDAMKARTPLKAWQPFLAPNTIPHLAEVPVDLDLIETSQQDYLKGRELVWRVYEVLASRQNITDMAASKVCHLKRPNLIAISDSYVRRLLVGPDRSILPQDPDRGRKYADRGVAVMDAIRGLGRLNAAPMRKLSAFVRTLRVEGQPVSLSQARILDILIWIEVATKEKHPYWGTWGADGPLAPAPAREPSIAVAGSGGVPDFACPKCAGQMIERAGPKGLFLGCARYPECKGTRSLYKCPECGGDMTMRDGPRGPFYGCLRYPACEGNRSVGEQARSTGRTVDRAKPPEPPARPTGWRSWIAGLLGQSPRGG